MHIKEFANLKMQIEVDSDDARRLAAACYDAAGDFRGHEAAFNALGLFFETAAALLDTHDHMGAHRMQPPSLSALRREMIEDLHAQDTWLAALLDVADDDANAEEDSADDPAPTPDAEGQEAMR